MYTIKKIDCENFHSSVWDTIEGIEISNFPWDTTGYKPKSTAKLCYTNNEIKVKFLTYEENLRVEVNEDYASTWHDSCVEYFLQPMGENDNRYFNFEINAKGHLLLQLDPRVPDRHTLDYVNTSLFNIKAQVNSDNYNSFNLEKPWTIEFDIPFSFIKDYFPNFKGESGTVMKGNLTKCGGKTNIPHFGTWADIVEVKPAYHRPQFFKEMILE